MRDRKQLVEKLNQLIEFAGADTPDEHSKLGAMLAACGATFMHHGGMTRDEIDYCVEQGIRAASGQSPLPLPGTVRE